MEIADRLRTLATLLRGMSITLEDASCEVTAKSIYSISRQLKDIADELEGKVEEMQ